MKLDILAFGAHPDDVELSCSGTLHSHIQMGKKVGVIDLTRGEMGSRGTAETRAIESANSTKVLGIHARENLGMEDGFLENNKANQLAIIEKLRKYQPEIVLINAPTDRHPDHGKASQLLIDACFLSGLVKIETKENSEIQKPWRPKRVYHYIQDKYIEPHFVVDISASFATKIASIKCFETQFFSNNVDGPVTYISTAGFLDGIEHRNKLMGKRIGVAYAEGFLCTGQAIGVTNLFDLVLPALV